MESSRVYESEDYGRMEFLAYFIFIFAGIGVMSILYFIGKLLIS